MSKEDVLSLIPFLGKKLIEKEQATKEGKAKKVSTTESVEDSLPFDKVIDNIIKIGKGKYRVIAKTNAISIDDMDKEDQDNVLMAYAEYINGLTKAYQTFIPSYSLDIRDNLQKLKQRYEQEDSEQIRAWLEDDEALQKELVTENDIIETRFYLVFKTDFKSYNNEEKDYTRAKKELLKMLKHASDELEGIGLHIEQLNYEEIGKVYYFYLNSFAAGVQEPVFDNDIINGEKTFKLSRSTKNSLEDNIEIFNLSEKETHHLEDGGLDFKQKIAPYSINDKESGEYIKLGSAYMTFYEIYDYPNNLPRLWAKKLYKFRKNIDISIHTKPIPTDEIAKELNKAALTYGSAMIDEKTGEKKKAVTMLEKRMESSSESVLKTMDELDSGEQAFFHFSMYVRLKARNLEELEDLCMEIETVLGSMRVLFRKCSDNMRNALWAVMPIGVDYLGSTRNMLTTGVVNSFPYVNFSFSHKDGFFLATHKYNLSFINFNPFKLENANGSILGASGAGKSVTFKKIAKGLTSVLDVNLTIIDPDGESKIKVFDPITKQETSFAESIDAEVIDYYVGSKNKINLLELEPDDEMESLIKPHISFIKIFLSHIIDMQKADRNKIDYSLIHLYNQFGFTDDKDSFYDDRRREEGKFYMGRPKRKAPELYDLFMLWYSNELQDIIGDTKYLANQLGEWTRKGSIDIFDGPTNVDFSNKRIIFNLKHLDKYVKEPGIFILMQKLWDLARRNPLQYKANLIDEAHTLMRNDTMGEYVFEINKRIRKYGGSNIFATQNVTDFNKTKFGPEILKNCSWSLLMKQAKNDVDILQDMFQMTRSEALKMTRFNPRKGEAYLVADGFRIPINVRVSQKELSTFTTKTSDLQKMSQMREITKVGVM